MAAQPIERIKIRQGDLTRCDADAVVNAANSTLLGGGGVDGAIHRAAGAQLLEACRSLGSCETGRAKITPGYNLKARYVIHVVGPVYRGGRSGEPELLASCYLEALGLARAHGCSSVAFPAISCGAYGYPMHEACRIAVRTVVDFLASNDLPAEVTFMLFEAEALAIYRSCLAQLGQSPESCQ